MKKQKYNLIDIDTNEEIICEKISRNEIDYYVSVEKFQVVLDETYYENDNCTPIYSFTEETLPKQYYLQKVIAATDRNVTLPTVIEKVKDLSIKSFSKLLETDKRLGFVKGYNKLQETHPNTDNDMIAFLEWRDKNYNYQNDGYYNENYKDQALTSKELLAIWKKQQLPKIYYRNIYGI